MLKKIMMVLAIFSQCWSIDADIFTIAEITNGGSGYKAANLVMLQKACQQFNDLHPDNEYKVNVPVFIGVPSNFVVQTISDLSKEDIEKIYNENQDPAIFAVKLEKILTKININDAVTALDQKMGGELRKFLDECGGQNKKIMVRSTGKEDTKLMANAGGNETIANVDPKNEAVWDAIKQVLLSYFSDKSQAQQKLGEVIEQQSPPLYLPVLMQVMVGETASEVPTSGVLFSEDPETHVADKFSGIAVLDFTYGHGEAVVNGMLPCDQLRIDDFGVITPNFVKKYQRLIPNPALGERLISVTNDKAMIERPSLEKDAAITLKQFGSFLEQKFYGYCVDIEFVVLGKEINIVQNRPITYDTQVFKPSYLDLELMGSILPEDVTKGKVIGTGHKEVRVVKKNNIIAEKNIRDALKIFLGMTKEIQATISFVLVEQMAPATSHEATVFRGVSKPVICVQDIKQIPDRLKDGEVLISPQQGFVIWNKDLVKVAITKYGKQGFAGYPINEISADAHWLGLRKVSSDELPKDSKYHDNPELAALQTNFLSCMKYYSQGLNKLGLTKDSPQYLLRIKALDLLKIQAAILQKTIKSENQITKAYPELNDQRSVQYLKLAEYAQSECVEKIWVQFINDLDKLDKQTQNKFSHMFRDLAGYKVLPIWLNSFFYNTAIKNKSAQDICVKLIEQFDNNNPHLAGVTELMKEVQSWDKESFADPKTFDQKFAFFQAMLNKFGHTKLYDVFKIDEPITNHYFYNLFTKPLNILEKAAKQVIKAQMLLDAFKEKCFSEIEKTLPTFEKIRESDEYQKDLILVYEEHTKKHADNLKSQQNEYDNALREIEELKNQNIVDQAKIDELTALLLQKENHKISETEKDNIEASEALQNFQSTIADLKEETRYKKKSIEKNNKSIKRAQNDLEMLCKHPLDDLKSKTPADIKNEAVKELDKKYSRLADAGMFEIANKAGLVAKYSKPPIDSNVFTIADSELVKILNENTIEELWAIYKKTIDEVNVFISLYSKDSEFLYSYQQDNLTFSDMREYLKHSDSRDQEINKHSANQYALMTLKKEVNAAYANDMSQRAGLVYTKVFESGQYAEKLSSIFTDKQPYLAQIVWLKCLDELVDCVDLSIKSLTGSTLYTKDDHRDAITSQKTQVLRFKKLLNENYILLKTILCLKNSDKTNFKQQNKVHGYLTDQLIRNLDGGFYNVFNKNYNNILKNIKNYLEGQPNSLSEIMTPSPQFNVTEQIIGNITTNDGIIRISSIETGDDLFTTMHQNELSTLSKLIFSVLEKNEVQYSQFVTTFMEQISKIGGRKDFSKPELSNLEFRGKKIILNYNVPLRNHSSTIRFECNKDGSQCEMTIEFFGQAGRMSGEASRWALIKSKIKKNLALKTLSQNDKGVSATFEIPMENLSEVGLKKYFTIFESCVELANG